MVGGVDHVERGDRKIVLEKIAEHDAIGQLRADHAAGALDGEGRKIDRRDIITRFGEDLDLVSRAAAGDEHFRALALALEEKFQVLGNAA